MSPAWVVTTLLFVVTVLFVFWWNHTRGTDYTLCPLKLTLGVPCPLCGGTSASFLWIEGDPISAFLKNPLVAVALPVFALFSLLWVGFGIRIGTTLPTPMVTALILLLLALNWAYVLTHG